MSKIDTTVGKLVSMIADGELRLPEMQRRYVWPSTRVRDLLDSLYRGYPSGTILVWETDREMPSRDMAVSQAVSPFAGHKLLLDGQQRLTSLSAILRGEPVVVRNRRKPIEILFNLDHPEGPPVEVTEVEDDAPGVDEEQELEADDDETGPNIQERLRLRTFIVAGKHTPKDQKWVRVSSLFSDRISEAQILKGLVKSFDDPNFAKYSSRIQAVRKIRDYPYVMHVLDKDLSYEEVAEIFVRVNSLGMKLRGSDLALAQITSRWRDSLKLFESFQEECEDKWFTLDLGLIVRALVVFTTGQSRFNSVATTPTDSFKKRWEAAKSAVRYAVNYLRTNAGIEDETLLASPLFIIALGYFAMKKDFRLSPADESDLRKWLYLGNTLGHYSGSSETTLDADLNIMNRGGSAKDLLEALERQVGRFEVQPADFVGKGQRSPLFSMAYLALKAKGAKDWRTRLGLSLTHQGNNHFIEHHHIFPKALLKKAGYGKSETHEIANMAFVTAGTNRTIGWKSPEDYLPGILEEQGTDALKTHCIPIQVELWKTDSYISFLEFRRAALAKAINEFISSQEAEQRTFNIDAVIASGESERVEFKSSARWDYREQAPSKSVEAAIVKTIAGFLNSKGGTLLIGVDDAGNVLGLEWDYKTLSKRPDRDGYQQFLVNLISQNISKEACASLEISFQPTAAGKEICVIHVEPSPKPAYVSEGQQNRFYLRTGNVTQELSVPDCVSYIASRWQAAQRS